MVDKKIEQRIQTAIKNTTPDLLNQIYASCDEQKGTVINMSNTSQNRKRKWMGRLIAAAAIVLVISGLSISQWNMNNTVNAKVILDVNPSVYLNVNAKEKVLSIEPGNEDGKKIIGDMNLKNTNLDVALNALLGSMLKNGYLSDLHNAILVSVEDTNPKKGAGLQLKLTNAIDTMLNDNQFKSLVFGQTVAGDQTIKELANKYGISEGKAALINEVIKLDNNLSFEELAKLSVHEIALIMESKGIEPKELTKTGNASEKAYIGKEEAKAIAFAHAKVDSNNVSSVEVEFDTEDGLMVYEVEFKAGAVEYEYDINAVTGDIIHFSEDIDDDKNTQNENNKTEAYIGKDKAKAIALSHSLVAENQVKNLKIEFDYDDKKAVYEIEFEANDFEYEYKIDAVTGDVIESEKEPKKAAASNKQSTSKASNHNKYINKNEALKIALKHAGLSKATVKEYEVELDKDEPTPVYEIEFKTREAEYDYEIDAFTGKILKSEAEGRDAKETSKSDITPLPKDSKSFISKEKVKEIVFQHAAVDAGQAKKLKIEFDFDDGKAIYEVEFKVGNIEYDYELDAITGNIIKSEKDIDD